MQGNVLEVSAPSPVNTTSFTLQLPTTSVLAINVRSNAVFFDCYWQGTTVTTNTRSFVYIPVGSSVTSWDDVTDRQNFVEFISIPQGTYVLVEKY